MMGNIVQPWSYNNRIPSELDYCAKVIEQLLNQLEKFNWPNKDVFGIHMAMEEAITNAIRHGNHCAPDKDVHIEMSITSNVFMAKVTDQGCGFDPNALPDPTEDENIEKTCGRGVMLMRNFVDEVEFNTEGNSVTLKKTRSDS